MNFKGASAAWRDMQTRCYNQNSRAYKWYGARGIKVCERWLKRENFIADMGEPAPGMELDRINNKGDYEPSNCRWTTRTEQNRNTSAVRLIEYNGERLPLPTWAERLGISRDRISKRLDAGWSVEKALSTPTRRYVQKGAEQSGK